jgi:hypothetical protein
MPAVISMIMCRSRYRNSSYAIRYAFSEEVRHLNSHLGEYEMPRLEILPPEETHSVNLGPISSGEGTIAGNYDVLKNIFLQQLLVNDETDFSCLVTSLLPCVSAQLNPSGEKKSWHMNCLTG